MAAVLFQCGEALIGRSPCHPVAKKENSWSMAASQLLLTQRRKLLSLQVIPEDQSCRTLLVGDGPALRRMGSKTVDQTVAGTLHCDPGFYFLEADAVAALQSPRMQLLSLGILNSMKPPRNPRLGDDQRTKYDMPRAIEDKHDVESACRPNEQGRKPAKRVQVGIL